MKAERFPRWAQRRLTAERREAFERLRWHQVGAAERARLKGVLGWKRTREDTLAYADELLASGLLEVVVANRLEVSPRYLRNLLAGRSETPDLTTRNPSIHADDLTLTCETGTGHQLAERVAENRPSPRRFVGFDDLDRWLDHSETTR